MTFIDLMSLHPLTSSENEQGIEKFISVNPSVNPGGRAAFGGHVSAQSVWAAAQTVGEGMVVHVRLHFLVTRSVYFFIFLSTWNGTGV